MMEADASHRQELKDDRLIEVFVGKQVDPYLLSGRTLKVASPFFERAIRDADEEDEEPGVLRFPEDHESAWKVLLYFITTGTLPPEVTKLQPQVDDMSTQQLLAVRCWAMGEKYMLPKFQDSVMWILLHWLDHGSLYLAAIKEAFCTVSSGCGLWQLAAEELAISVAHGSTKYSALEEFCGIEGFISSFSFALRNAPVDPGLHHESMEQRLILYRAAQRRVEGLAEEEQA